MNHTWIAAVGIGNGQFGSHLRLFTVLVKDHFQADRVAQPADKTTTRVRLARLFARGVATVLVERALGNAPLGEGSFVLDACKHC